MNKSRQVQLKERKQTIQAFRYFRSGPLPPFQELAGYEEICPGAANRIITQFEQQAQHRQNLESKVIKANIDHERYGIFVSGVITILLILVGAFLIYHDKSVAGYLTLFGSSIFVGGSFVFSKYKENKKVNPKSSQSSENSENPEKN